VTNTTGVFRTTNAGASWTTLTGNLLSLNPSTIRSIALVTGASGDALVVGTQNGVYYATEASGFATWSRLGTALPVVPVYDLDYDAADDVLVVGTMGRGAWHLTGASVVTGGL
jgi:photosystem II stability/assembly factor-like uncharacterized protein